MIDIEKKNINDGETSVDTYKSGKAYWKNKIDLSDNTLKLVRDVFIETDKSCKFEKLSHTFDEAWSDKIRKFCLSENINVFQFLLSLYDIILYKLSGNETFPVGFEFVPDNDGLSGNSKENVSMFLFHSAVIDARTPFREFLLSVKKDFENSITNSSFQFEYSDKDSDLKINDDPGKFFHYSVLFSSNAGCDTAIHDGLEMGLILDETTQISISVLYNTGIFNFERIEVILRQITFLIEQITENPMLEISDYSLVFSGSGLPDPKIEIEETVFTPVTEFIFGNAKKNCSDCAAIRQNGIEWTFNDCVRDSMFLAKQLVKQGIKKGDVIAVTGERSYWLIVSMIAVFLSGGVLVTLDKFLPAERKKMMLDESKSDLIINVDKDNNSLSGENLRVSLFFIDVLKGVSTGDVSEDDVSLPCITHNDPAYIFFTSGTTGKPKGVLGCHKGLSHFISWQMSTFEIGKGDNVAQLTGFSFDVVLRDIFLPLVSGATLCLPDMSDGFDLSQALEWIDREKITVFHMVPSLQKILISTYRKGITLENIRWLFSAGEPLTDRLISEWRKNFPLFGKIVNLYGPTETTLAKCYYIINESDIKHNVQPIGKPISHTQIMILNGNRNLCGHGELGEITIRTPFRSYGYVNNSKEQAEKFVQNPYTENNDDSIYFTGDLGRYRTDGLIDILGRKDHQVKINGVRIELGEIESVMRQNSKIKDVLLYVREDNPEEKRLCAYYIVKSNQQFENDELKQFVKKKLPEFMVPHFFIEMEKFPLNPNGKVDRKALPLPDYERCDVESSLPETELEKKISEIFKSVLGINRAGVNDSFFDLGGNSLSAIQLVSGIEKETGMRIPILAVFKYPNIKQLAAIVNGDINFENKVMNLIKKGGQMDPVFYIGSTVIAAICADYWEKERPVYGINILASDSLFEDLNNYSLHELASKYVDEMMSVWKGPYIISSYCLDEVVAYELCQELVRRGKEIKCLFLIDYPPLGKTYSFAEMLRRGKLRFLINQVVTILHKIYYKFDFKFSRELKKLVVNIERNFYDAYYAKSTLDYKAEQLNCPIVNFLSLENLFQHKPDFITINEKRTRNIFISMLHLPMYRKKRSIKKIIDVSKNYISKL